MKNVFNVAILYKRQLGMKVGNDDGDWDW